LNERKIEARMMMPLTNQPCYEGWFNPLDFPVAQHINECGFYVGCHEGMARSEMNYVIEALKEIFYEGETAPF
jgi:dTDP-4-amino-4,6-dideoxygalactose transaminase